MNINLFPLTIIWMIVAVAVIGLIAYRAWIAQGEDERLHVHQSEIGLVSQQVATAHRLDAIDRWGQALTVTALLYGLALGGGYLWLAASNGAVR